MLRSRFTGWLIATQSNQTVPFKLEPPCGRKTKTYTSSSDRCPLKENKGKSTIFSHTWNGLLLVLNEESLLAQHSLLKGQAPPKIRTSQIRRFLAGLERVHHLRAAVARGLQGDVRWLLFDECFSASFRGLESKPWDPWIHLPAILWMVAKSISHHPQKPTKL